MNDHKDIFNCRVCLRYDLKQISKCLSLFEIYNGCSISEKVTSIANVNIKEGDGLPDMICPECLLQLENAVAFKLKCEVSNKILWCNVLLSKQSTAQKSQESKDIKDEVIEIELDCDLIEPDPVRPDPVEPDQVEPDPVDPEPVEPDLVKKNLEYSDTEDRLENIIEDNEEEEISEPPLRKSRALDLKLICDDCKGSFKSKCKLRVHWKAVHQPEKLICQNCKRMFKTYKAYNLHMKSANRNCLAATKVRIEGQGKTRMFHCKECSYKTKRIKDIDTHLATHTGDRRFQCKDCPRTFTQHASLQCHRESTHKDYKINTTCHLCGKHLLGRTNYYRHMKAHRQEKVQCQVCHKLLKNNRYLKIHMQRHSGTKSFSCEVCAASFYTYCEVYNHRVKVHMKSRSIKCDLCDYKLTNKSALKRHKAKHTGTNVICLVCGQFSENAEKLAIHQKRHFNRNIQCPQCEKMYHNKRSLYKHMGKFHRCTMLVEKREEPKVNIKQESPPRSRKDEVVILLSPPTIIPK